MRSHQIWRPARVIAAEEIAEDIRQVTFAVDGFHGAFDPGSHTNIKVSIKGIPAIRTYTVVPSAAETLAIAVKLHPNSRGGSAFIWQLQVGDRTEMTEPENRFELSWRAEHYLLIAGGIGITPLYGMAKALAARGRPLKLLYAARRRDAMAFASDLQSLLGERFATFAQDEGQTLNLQDAFADLPSDTEAYVCGPLALLDAAKAAWIASGRPISRFLYEVFGDSGLFPEESFTVSVQGLDLSVDVRPDQTMLEALEDAGVPMIHDCRRGECGLCAVKIVSATAPLDHRDVFFSEEERQHDPRICACVSRARGGQLIIDTGYVRDNISMQAMGGLPAEAPPAAEPAHAG